MTIIAHASVAEHSAVAAGAAIAAVGYGWMWIRHPTSSPWHLVAWFAGIGALLASVIPAMEAVARRSFAGHMVQHLLMIVVAAPLLVAARPVQTARSVGLLSARATAHERSVVRWWRSNGALAGAGLFIVTLYVTHLTAIYDDALTNRFVHDAEHLAYVGSAVALWAALRGRSRQAATARIGAVFAVIAASALLGVVLLSASSPLVPTYDALLGSSDALRDQRVAASLMWIGGMATTLPLLIVSVWSWAAAEERVAIRAEALADARTEAPVSSR